MEQHLGEGGDELTQQVGGHQRQRQELAKATTPGCLLCLWNTKEPQTRGLRDVCVFGLGGKSCSSARRSPLLGSASGCWGAW